ncbi:nucleoside triphosphate pyrophosphohydrolase family protein [Mesorhizobium sp. M0924]|uniref:nucleoside triphosphate pyrophosphohydrolase family protein n=1 Tax=unclassified Mesorhizobium TaxID=325217 RepID=UPI00333708C7
MSVADGTELMRSQASLFDDAEAPVGLDEYQQFTIRTDRNAHPGTEGLGFVLLGLFGEVGSLLSALKKKQRDKDAFVAYHDAVIEELGDALWYFANAALRAGLSLSTLAQHASATLEKWDYHGLARAVTFADLQQSHSLFAGPIASDIVEQRLLALAGKAGRLLEDWSSGRIAANRDVLSADLVEIFRALLIAADDAEVSLDEAVRRNVVKTLGRWPDRLDWGPLFDADFPSDEQLPRHMTMVFTERTVAGRSYVVQQLNGVNIGSRLTDNRHEPDDYRFHDVFHLAFAAILGWSPTLRALLSIKRKSRPEIDENEDGARAGIIEEGISTWIFNHGVRNADFRNVATLDYGLLKAVHELVRGYEVEARPLWQWERAILEGFRIFRDLRHHRGGAVTIDLERRTIDFEVPQ